MASAKSKATKPRAKEVDQETRKGKSGEPAKSANEAVKDIDLFRDEFKKAHGDIRSFIVAMEECQPKASQPCIRLLHKLDQAVATGGVIDVNEDEAIYVDMFLLALPSREKWLLYINLVKKVDLMRGALRADAPNDLIEHILYNGQVSGRSREEMAAYLKDRATPEQVLLLGEDDEREESAARILSLEESAFFFASVADAAVPMAFAAGMKTTFDTSTPEGMRSINEQCGVVKELAQDFVNANLACGNACPPEVFDALVDLCASSQVAAADILIRGIATIGDGPEGCVCY